MNIDNNFKWWNDEDLKEINYEYFFVENNDIEFGVFIVPESKEGNNTMARGLTSEEREILYSDFPDSKCEYDRETIQKYSVNIRGSVRLATGRFYTQKEMDERAEKAFSIKL